MIRWESSRVVVVAIVTLPVATAERVGVSAEVIVKPTDHTILSKTSLSAVIIIATRVKSDEGTSTRIEIIETGTAVNPIGSAVDQTAGIETPTVDIAGNRLETAELTEGSGVAEKGTTEIITEGAIGAAGRSAGTITGRTATETAVGEIATEGYYLV